MIININYRSFGAQTATVDKPPTTPAVYLKFNQKNQFMDNFFIIFAFKSNMNNLITMQLELKWVLRRMKVVQELLPRDKKK